MDLTFHRTKLMVAALVPEKHFCCLGNYCMLTSTIIWFVSKIEKIQLMKMASEPDAEGKGFDV